MKGLMGDQSDNIPGVPGVGEKTAIKLLKEFHTVEELLESIDKVSGKKLKEKLTEFKEQAVLSKELVTILREAPIEVQLGDLQFKEYDKEKVSTIFKELGFQSLLNKMGDSDEPEAEEAVLEDIEFVTVEEITEDIFTDRSCLYVEVLEENYHYAEILGFSLVNEKGSFFIANSLALNSPIFKAWAEDEEKKKIVYDAKRSEVILRHHGIHLSGVKYDVLIASYLADPSASIEDISSIAKRYGIAGVQSDDVFYGKGAKRRIPEDDQLAPHLVRKALVLSQLEEKLEEELKNNQQLELFYDLEMPLSLILADMESQGVKVDRDRLNSMGEELKGRLKDLETSIHSLAGEKFNINSPKQLGVILFEKLGLPVIKKTKTGYSTSADVLEQLEQSHEIIRKHSSLPPVREAAVHLY